MKFVLSALAATLLMSFTNIASAETKAELDARLKQAGIEKGEKQARETPVMGGLDCSKSANPDCETLKKAEEACKAKIGKERLQCVVEEKKKLSAH